MYTFSNFLWVITHIQVSSKKWRFFVILKKFIDNNIPIFLIPKVAYFLIRFYCILFLNFDTVLFVSLQLFFICTRVTCSCDFVSVLLLFLFVYRESNTNDMYSVRVFGASKRKLKMYLSNDYYHSILFIYSTCKGSI